MRKCEKNDVKAVVAKMKTKTYFVIFLKCLLNFKTHVLQSKLNKVTISNFVKFQLQYISSKIEGIFEKKMTKFPIKIVPKQRIIRQLKGP